MEKALVILKHLMTFCGPTLYNDCKEAIAELEEVIKPKTCDGCKHRSHLSENLTNQTTNGFCVENGFFTKHGFCCNKYEPKEL